MKKILLFVSCFLFALTSCEIDNYEGPDASIHGSILDEQTGELVGSDMENGNAIKVREHGFTNATDQTWYITNTGEYRNNMVFAATYDVRFENGNFYPFEVKDFVVKSGDNVYDFKVIPYIRVKSPKVEKNGNVITATFSLEAGKQEVKLKEIQLFAFSDMWVGNNVKLTLNGGTDKQVFRQRILYHFRIFAELGVFLHLLGTAYRLFFCYYILGLYRLPFQHILVHSPFL